MICSIFSRNVEDKIFRTKYCNYKMLCLNSTIFVLFHLAINYYLLVSFFLMVWRILDEMMAKL
jgi:hypothetical protein